MKVLFMALAIIAGCCVSLQGVVNSRLREQWDLGSTILMNSVLVMVAAIVLFFVTGAAVPSRETLAQTEWPYYLGAACGFTIICVTAVVFGRLPATVALGLILFGQFATAMVIDQFGLLQMDQQPFSWWKVGGLALIACGVVMLRR